MSKIIFIIIGSLILVAVAAAGELIVTATKGLNVRAGPGTEFEIVGTVACNEIVTELDFTPNGGDYGGWYKVRTSGGKVGWVCAGTKTELWLEKTGLRENEVGSYHSSKKADFEKSQWGDAIETIKAVKGETLSEEEENNEGFIVSNFDYNGSFGSLSCTVRYMFGGGKLVGGFYMKDETDPLAFGRWFDILKAKYGNPNDINVTGGIGFAVWNDVNGRSNIMLSCIKQSGGYFHTALGYVANEKATPIGK